MPRESKRPSNNPAGRPLSSEVTAAVQRATIEILAESGYRGMSMDAVAKRAGVSRPALYRRFPSTTSLAVAALEQAGREAAAFASSNDISRELEKYLSAVAMALDRRGPVGRAFRGALSEALIDDEFASKFALLIERRREPVAARLREAYPSLKDQDVQQMLDLLFGPLLYRLLIRDLPVSRREMRASIKSALETVRHIQHSRDREGYGVKVSKHKRTIPE
jgi:AcrR family transcriptional regulator